MSYNGSGLFQINSSGQPVVTGTTISATVFNALTADLATGLSTAITKDGQTATTVRVPFIMGINSSLATDSSSSTTGSIITAGGLGVAKAVYIGTSLNIGTTLNVTGVATLGNGAVLGTPASMTATNITGTAAGLTAGAATSATTATTATTATGANALYSATTTVNVSSATAPTTGQVLTATGASAATWQTASATAPGTRQTQLYGALDSSGYNNTISAGAGLNFNVAAAAVNAAFTYAQGQTDSIATLTADASNQGSLAASNTNYIYNDYLTASTVTWANGLVPPQYGYAFDKGRNSLLSLNNISTDDFGATWTNTGVTFTNTSPIISGTYMGVFNGSSYIKSPTFTSLGSGSWTMRAKAKPSTVGTLQCVFSANISGNNYGANIRISAAAKLVLELSSTGSSHDICQTTSTGASLVANTAYDIELTYDALAGKYFVYVDGVADSSLTTTSALKVCGIAGLMVGANTYGTPANIFAGNIQAFEYWPCCLHSNGTTFTPRTTLPAITDQKVHFYSIPAMTMYEVTSASATAGTNSGMTARNRVFVGEQDTNGTVVTATRNYALRGQYVGSRAALPALGTAVNLSANLGTDQATPFIEYLNITAENGYTPGMIVREVAAYNGVDTYSPTLRQARNTIGWTMPSTSLMAENATNGSNASFTVANWNYRMIDQRKW